MSAPMLYKIVCVVLLLLSQTAPSSTQKISSYTDTFSQAAAVSIVFNSQSAASTLQKDQPLLFSSTLFQHEVVKASDQLAKLDLHADLLTPNVSAVCFNDTLKTIFALRERKIWALEMLDAMGKPPADVMAGNLLWLGSVSECLNITAWQEPGDNDPSIPSPLYKGQYCTAEMLIEKPSATVPLPIQLNLGVCVPDSCSSSDVVSLINWLTAKLGFSLPWPVKAICHDPHIPLDGLVIAGIAVLGVFGVLILVGTMLDVIHNYRRNQREEAESRSEHEDMEYSYGSHKDFNDDAVLFGSERHEPSFPAKLLMAFSVYTNGAELLSTEQPGDSLRCVHGIRFLSMTWVLLGDTFALTAIAGANLFRYFPQVRQRLAFQVIFNAGFAVDTFFLLSGLLVAYLSLKKMKRNAGRMNWLKFYLHRIWRLTPVYMLIILMFVSVGRYFGSDPQWLPQQHDRGNCLKSWWTNLLYVNNFVDTDKTCMMQSWYLANDMQFYILSPVIFVPLYHSPVFGIVLALAFLTATTVTPLALTLKNHFPPSFLVEVDAASTGANFLEDFYIKPYNRMGPYIIGLLTGYLLYRSDCKAKIPKVVNMVCWTVATAAALAVLYGLYHASQGHPVSLVQAAVYNALSGTAWALAVAWLIFACVTGYGGFVNTVLSWEALIPLSRLTYCVYLLHIMVLFGYLFSQDIPFYYSDSSLIVLFLALLTGCCLLAAVISMAFEAPMRALEKLLFKYNNRH